MSKRNSKTKRRVTLYMFVLFTIIIGIALTFPNYMIQIKDKYNEKKELEKTLMIMEKEEKTLEKEVRQLSDSNYIAKIARQKYLLSKDGEIIIKIDEEKNEEEDKTTEERVLLSKENIILLVLFLFLILLRTIIKMKKRKQNQ